MCYILFEYLGRVMAKYKATYQIGIKSTTSEARKRKTRRKRGSSQLVKTEGKKHALFSVPWEEPPLLRVLVLTVSNGKQLIVKTYIFLLQRQTRHACATFAGQTVLPAKPRRLSGTSAPEGE